MSYSHESFGSSNHIAEEDIHEALVIFREISDLLNTGLDETSLNLCFQLILTGVNPDALALAIKEIRRYKEGDSQQHK